MVTKRLIICNDLSGKYKHKKRSIDQSLILEHITDYQRAGDNLQTENTNATE